jgi:hypothetical protein
MIIVVDELSMTVKKHVHDDRSKYGIPNLNHRLILVGIVPIIANYYSIELILSKY